MAAKGSKRATTVTVHGRLPGGFALQLGEEPVLTPGGRPLLLATRELAEALVREEAAGIVLDDVTLYSVACTETDFVQAPHGNGRAIRMEMARVHLPHEVNTVMHLQAPEFAAMGTWIRGWEALSGSPREPLDLPPYGAPLVVERAFPEPLLARVESRLVEAPDAVFTAMLNGLDNGLSSLAPYLLCSSRDDADFFHACMAWAESPIWGSTDGTLRRAEVLAAWVRGGGTYQGPRLGSLAQ